MLLLLLDDSLGGLSQSGDQIQDLLNQGSKSFDLCLAQKLSLEFICLIECLYCFRQGLHIEFYAFLVQLPKAQLNLLDVHGIKLLEKLNITFFTDCNKDVFKGLKCKFPDLVRVGACHMRGYNLQ
jgi:hypothetical protein